MATPPVIQLDDFLTPISEEAPAGADVRADFSPNSLYFTVKEAQATARTEERKRREAFDEQLDTAFRPEDWMPVIKYGEEILFEKAKDLEVAAWYVEALLRHSGFAGLRDGVRLLRGLSERFWDDLYPRPDEDGLITRVAAVAALNGEDSPGTLVWPVSNVPITSVEPWGAWQYRQAQTLQGLTSEELEKQVAEGAVSLEMFDKAVADTPIEFFRDLIADIGESIAELRQLTEFLDDRCGLDESGYPIAPSTRDIEEALEEVLSTVRTATAGLVLEPEPEAAAVEEAVGDGGAGVAPGAAGGVAIPSSEGVMSREQAFRAIQQLADYFKRTEPHSPIAYLLEKAVRWGKMPLPRLLHELIFDQPTLTELYRVMGVEDAQNDDQRP